MKASGQLCGVVLGMFATLLLSMSADDFIQKPNLQAAGYLFFLAGEDDPGCH